MLFPRMKLANFAYRGQKRKYLYLFTNNGNISLYSSVSNSDVLNDLRASESVDEVFERKRNKCHLPEEVIRKYITKEVPPLFSKSQFARLPVHYGRYGKRCGLNPGIAWPTKQKLLELIEDNKLLDPPLQETLQKIRAAKEEKMRERLEYEAEVDRNMANADSYMKEYHKRVEEKKAAAIAAQEKRALLIEEISEFLGYNVSPKDPKFQEAVEMREKEKKKAKKILKQQESYEKLLAKLMKNATENKAGSIPVDAKTNPTAENTEANPTATDNEANPTIAKSKGKPTADTRLNSNKDIDS